MKSDRVSGTAKQIPSTDEMMFDLNHSGNKTSSLKPQSNLNRRKAYSGWTRIFHLNHFAISKSMPKTYSKFMIRIYKLMGGNPDRIFDLNWCNGFLKCQTVRWKRPEKRNKPGVATTARGVVATKAKHPDSLSQMSRYGWMQPIWVGGGGGGGRGNLIPATLSAPVVAFCKGSLSRLNGSNS